eukprot:jgi/Chlat1/1751/Chrsp134S02087
MEASFAMAEAIANHKLSFVEIENMLRNDPAGRSDVSQRATQAPERANNPEAAEVRDRPAHTLRTEVIGCSDEAGHNVSRYDQLLSDLIARGIRLREAMAKAMTSQAEMEDITPGLSNGGAQPLRHQDETLLEAAFRLSDDDDGELDDAILPHGLYSSSERGDYSLEVDGFLDDGDDDPRAYAEDALLEELFFESDEVVHRGTSRAFSPTPRTRTTEASHETSSRAVDEGCMPSGAMHEERIASICIGKLLLTDPKLQDADCALAIKLPIAPKASSGTRSFCPEHSLSLPRQRVGHDLTIQYNEQFEMAVLWSDHHIRQAWTRSHLVARLVVTLPDGTACRYQGSMALSALMQDKCVGCVLLTSTTARRSLLGGSLDVVIEFSTGATSHHAHIPQPLATVTEVEPRGITEEPTAQQIMSDISNLSDGNWSRHFELLLNVLGGGGGPDKSC